MANKLLFRDADTDGDGTGTKNAIGNYAGSPTEFKVTAQPNEYLSIERVLVGLSDAGTFDSGGYGNGLALTNGISAYVTDNLGTIVYYLTDEDNPIKTNGDWAHTCYDLTVHAFGSGDQYMAVRWTFARAGQPIELLPGWSVNFLLEDSMIHLTGQYFQLQGYHKYGTRGATDTGHA